MNYSEEANATYVMFEEENVAFGNKNVAFEEENVAIEVAIEALKLNSPTIEKAKAVFMRVGTEGIFARLDIIDITGASTTAAGNLIKKLKNAGLIELVSGFGKGKYKFVKPQD